jgi:tRNA-specific 2-thiouridylase
MKKRVLCAMSGGVDSSVCAFLLKEMGYDVVGATMKIWSSEKKCGEKSCCGTDAVEDARRIAGILDIPFYAFEMEDIFRDTVIKDFISEYGKGRTPNPCIICNEILKFGYLIEKAEELGAEAVATGHYARIIEKDGLYQLCKGLDSGKDQAYFLYTLNQELMSKVLFPVGDKNKSEIREIASREGLERVAQKPDSQDICFVEGDYRDFLKANSSFQQTSGEMLKDGVVVGEHQGLGFYTIGQRKGLGISFPEKTYVVALDSEQNRVILGSKDELLKSGVIVDEFVWTSMEPQDDKFKAQVKIRYQHQPVPSLIEPLEDGKMRITFSEQQESVAPGQSAVLYDGDVVLAGGRILSCF